MEIDHQKEKICKKVVEALAKRFGFVVDSSGKTIVIQDQTFKHSVQVESMRFRFPQYVALTAKSWHDMLNEMIFHRKFFCIDTSEKELAKQKSNPIFALKHIDNDFYNVSSFATLCMRLDLEGIDLGI